MDEFIEFANSHSEHFGLLPEVHEADKQLMTGQLRERIDEIYHEYPYPLPMPEHYLTDDEIIRFGNHELLVIHTPGHTPGSVFFSCEAEKIAFSGDTLFYKGIGRSDLPDGNHDELNASLKFITEYFLTKRSFIQVMERSIPTIDYVKVNNNPYLR